MQFSRRSVLGCGSLVALAACQRGGAENPAASTPLAGGSIERFSDALYTVIAPDAEISLLAEGFLWSEGPVWDFRRGRLLFCDIPNDRMISWNATTGLETFLSPAGADHGEEDVFSSPGTNGLYYEKASDSLLVCNQNARSLDRLDLASGERTKLVDRYQGAKLNSPNDVVRSANGTIYFTDPPYGLVDWDTSPGIELDHRGVYSLAPDGRLSLLVDDMTLPNGLAFSPDESILYVSQSDPEAAILRRFSVNADGTLSGGETWLDLTAEVSEALPGLPDGMAVDTSGNVWATGPGGVLVISPTSELLGRINTGRATANCAFGEDGSTLFMTANDTLLSVPTLASGVYF